jgi:RNA polymerase sigma factor (sigma-70 family)
MLRVAYLIVGSTEAAEDLVHDSFVEVRRRWDLIDNPGGYLRRTVVNRCLSWQRHRRVESEHLRRLEPINDETTSAEPSDLWPALHRLAVAQRTALVLTYYVDLTSEQTAEVMGCRPSTVRSLVRRGLINLRKEMQ